MQKKCKYCTKDVSAKELKEFPQKDREGNNKFSKKGKQLVFYAHADCHANAQKENAERNNLYDYLLSAYFTNFVPPLILKELNVFRTYCTFETMRECLEHYSDEIAKCKVSDTTHLCRLLMYFIKQNLNDFMTLRAESKEIEQKDEVFVKVKKKEEEMQAESYDIL